MDDNTFKMKPKNDDYQKEHLLFLGCHFQVPIFILEAGGVEQMCSILHFCGGDESAF